MDKKSSDISLINCVFSVAEILVIHYIVDMASIFKRLSKGCKTWSFQVQIRRKDIPYFAISFSTYSEAAEWVKLNEKKYIANPEKYLKQYDRVGRLAHRREREFNNIGK